MVRALTEGPNHRRDFVTARLVLRGIEKRRHPRAEAARARVLEMMTRLDTILSRLPEEAPPEDLQEIDRIVNALRTADQSLSRGIVVAGMQSLELARARIERMHRRLEEGEPRI